MDDKKICFIICTNDELYMRECRIYIERLYVPDGYKVELLTITDAISMTSGYNEAMERSNAKYKVYLHQDTFIINRNFLNNIINIFSRDEKIGLIGVVGAEKMPADGIMWHTNRVGILYSKQHPCDQKDEVYNKFYNPLVDVAAVDGLCMVTSKDIHWRSDLFDGWDFYDVSQSAEFLKAGYRVVVPVFETPCCIHDDGVLLNMWNYDKYRQIYLQEYEYML